MKKKMKLFGFFLFSSISLVACTTEADTVNYNLSQSADSFNVERRITFFNGITDEYLLTVEGKCSMDLSDSKALKVTCKVGEDLYKRHYLGLSDNVSYFAEQIEAKKENPYNYKVVFRPEEIIPDIVLETSLND